MPNQTKFGSVFLAILFIFLIANCNHPNTLHSSISLKHLQSFPISVKRTKGYHKGKRSPDLEWSSVYLKTTPKKLDFPTIDADFAKVLSNHLKVFKYKKKSQKDYRIGELTFTKTALKTTVETLLANGHYSTEMLEDHLDAYQIKGRDGKGNVYITGYYTPVVKVDYQPSKEYAYPIYGKPNRQEWDGKLPSRFQIDGEGALVGKGLELAYARSLADIYYMQLQGSGIVEYPNKKQEYLSFKSTNGHSYRSIEKYVVKNASYKVSDISVEGMKRFFKQYPEFEKPILYTNPSYVFFDRARNQPHGAGHVPLTAGISIAVDEDYIPLGSVLLAAVPVLNSKGAVSHHEYRILLAQDKGGAIRGSGHIDLYSGKDTEGRQKAMSMHHYGQIWLLLPKIKDENNGEISLLQ